MNASMLLKLAWTFRTPWSAKFGNDEHGCMVAFGCRDAAVWTTWGTYTARAGRQLLPGYTLYLFPALANRYTIHALWQTVRS